ncbi:FtsH protease activity modulator HflK [Caballeronia sordidicola]|uniref:FtsH protease activity modulator HflK n=1 Tax=Caballeronia sordidicola TaxID=196367 RepID=UPI0004CFF2F0|nr:FtsH protease activity modulator HflK [Caballeronia sordidicola]
MNDYNERSNRQLSHAVFSINDPRWGRGDGNGDGKSQEQKRPQDQKRPSKDKDGEGPPDLDEMWRDFNKKLAGLFGKKPAGGGPRADNGRGAKIGMGIVIGVLIAIYLGSGVFVVQDGNVGVVSRFGKYEESADAGIHWRLPYPFESQEIVNTSQIRSVEIGRNNTVTQANVRDASLLTHDADIIDVRFAVQYQIKSATDYLFRNVDPDQNVTESAQAAIREIAGKHSTDDLLFKDREALRAKLLDTIQASLDLYKTGLQVTGVTIESVQVPSQVQPAFEDAAKVRQDNERAVDTAKAYADQLLPRAKTDAARMIDDAKGYSNRVVSQAQGNAERFKQVYAEYSKAPAVIRQRMYLDTMQQIYSRATKVFVDSKSSNNVVYLPLDKLVEANRQNANAAAVGTVPTGASGVAAGTAPAGANQPVGAAPAGVIGGSITQDARAESASAASAVTAQSAAPASAAASAAASGAAAQSSGDASRSRDAFRSRSREDDTQ